MICITLHKMMMLNIQPLEYDNFLCSYLLLWQVHQTMYRHTYNMSSHHALTMTLTLDIDISCGCSGYMCNHITSISYHIYSSFQFTCVHQFLPSLLFAVRFIDKIWHMFITFLTLISGKVWDSYCDLTAFGVKNATFFSDIFYTFQLMKYTVNKTRSIIVLWSGT